MQIAQASIAVWIGVTVVIVGCGSARKENRSAAGGSSEVGTGGTFSGASDPSIGGSSNGGSTGTAIARTGGVGGDASSEGRGGSAGSGGMTNATSGTGNGGSSNAPPIPGALAFERVTGAGSIGFQGVWAGSPENVYAVGPLGQLIRKIR